MVDFPIPPSNLSMPRRLFVLSRADLGQFSELLVEAFPDIWFVPWISIEEQRAADPPTVRAIQSLVELYDDPDPFHHRCKIVFGTAWQPHWERDGSGWRFANWVYPNGEVALSGYTSSGRGGDSPEPPSMSDGELYFRIDGGDRAQVAMVRKVFRLLTKVATNRVQSVRFPSLEVMVRQEKGGVYWIGLDAARWCREKPDRMVAYQGRQRWGFRPLD
jgi:hypothetical protein